MNDTHETHSRPCILLVEDNEVLATTVEAYLSAAGMGSVSVDDGDQVLNAFKSQRFDAVILDIMLPGVDGLTLCRRIRAISNVSIIMVTALTTEEDVIAGLEAGADDYVRKPFSPRELMARVHSAVRRSRTPPGVADQLNVGSLTLEAASRTITMAGKKVSLTATEFDLLAILMRSPGRVFTRSQLKKMVLGQLSEVSDRTINTHLYNLRKKLDFKVGEPGSIRTERGVGYRLEPESGAHL